MRHGWTDSRALLPPSTAWRAFTLSHENCPQDLADKHKHYNGSLKSNVIGPVALPPYKAEWNLTFAEKKLPGPHQLCV